MKRRKRLCGLLTGALGAVLALALAGTARAVDTSGVQVVSEKSSITVHVYDNGGVQGEQGNGTAIGDTSSLGEPVVGATVGYYKVGEVVQYTDSYGKTSLMYAVSDEAVRAFSWAVAGTPVTIEGKDYKLIDSNTLTGLLGGKTSSELKETDGITWTENGPTNSEGKTTINDASGLYLLIGYSMPANVTTEIVPFFVSAPMPNVSAGGGWLTDIHVYPKVQVASAMTISKTVDGQPSKSVNSNTNLAYKIEATVPADAKNLAKFEIKDEIPVGLTISGGNPTVTIAGEVALTDNYYSISSTENEVSFSLKSEGLDKFVGTAANATTITITYTAQLSEDANLADAITNKATLTYQYEGNADATTDDSATVYAYGIDLTKTFADATEYKGGAKFALFTDESCSNEKAIKVTSSNGVYWVDPKGDSAELVVTEASGGSKSGTLTVKGLAEGTYYLKETAAPDGYSTLKEPIKITVSVGASSADLATKIKAPAATVNDVTATIEGRTDSAATKVGLVQLTVENQPENFFTGLLPNTGDVGSVVAAFVGLGLVCVAVVLVVNGRRKGGRAES